MIVICSKCGKVVNSIIWHPCKPKTQMEYRNENYEFDTKLGVW